MVAGNGRSIRAVGLAEIPDLGFGGSAVGGHDDGRDRLAYFGMHSEHRQRRHCHQAVRAVRHQFEHEEMKALLLPRVGRAKISHALADGAVLAGPLERHQ